jgi:hypothetical protein
MGISIYLLKIDVGAKKIGNMLWVRYPHNYHDPAGGGAYENVLGVKVRNDPNNNAMVVYHLNDGTNWVSFIGLYDTATGDAMALRSIGNAASETWVFGIEYCLTDNTIIISGYSIDGDHLASTNWDIFIMKLSTAPWGVNVIDTWIWTNSWGAGNDLEYSFDMTTHIVDNTEYFYVATVLYDQLVGTNKDAGIFRVNYTLGHEEDYVFGFDEDVEMKSIDVDDWGNQYFGLNKDAQADVIVGKIG